MSPEGAGGYGGNRLRTYGLDRVHSSPFRAKRLFRLTQGKPWAKFSCPFGAGRLTDAKQIPPLYLYGKCKRPRFTYPPEEAKRDALLTSRKRQSGTLYLLTF
jgi:hypothetical protein